MNQQTSLPDSAHTDHSPQAISARLARVPKQSYLRDWVYGGIDGAVTTFAIVTGVTGADLSPNTILIMGVANLIADGISMAASNWLGTKAESDQMKAIEATELREIELQPEGEKTEIRVILENMGLSGETLSSAVTMVTQDKNRWVKLMMREEHGLPSVARSPWKAGRATFWAFLICGSAPLLPYFILSSQAFLASVILTAVVFFAIGSLKSRWSITPWWSSGLTTLAVGAVAALVAYGVGDLLGFIVADL